MPTLQYKDFEGSAEIDTDTLVCRGKILYIDDLVTYQANSPANLVREFHASVDDYLETCALVGKIPQKPCKGQFNVRVTQELHRQAQRRATLDETSLNAVVASALDSYLSGSRAHEEPPAKMLSPLATIDSASQNFFIRLLQPKVATELASSSPLISTAGAATNQRQQFH